MRLSWLHPVSLQETYSHLLASTPQFRMSASSKLEREFAGAATVNILPMVDLRRRVDVNSQPMPCTSKYSTAVLAAKGVQRRLDTSGVMLEKGDE